MGKRAVRADYKMNYMKKKEPEKTSKQIDPELAACRRELEQARADIYMLDTILETSIDPITVLDGDGRILRANPAFLALLGCQSADIMNREPLLFAFVEEGVHETTYGEPVTIDQAYYEKSIDMTGQLFKTGKIENHEFYISRFDNKLVPVEGNFTLLRDTQGNRTGAFAVLRDITQHKLQASTIRQARDFLENIFQTTDDGLFVTSYDGYIIRANRAFVESLGYEEEELHGRHYSVLYAQKLVQDMLKTQESLQHYVTKYSRKDGSIIDVEINLSLLKDAAGSTTGSVVAVRDITLRRQMEEELRFAHGELEKKVAERTASLEEVNTALRVLLKRREEDKASLEDKVLMNINRLINPCLQKLKNAGLDQRQQSYLDILDANFQDIVSPFLQALTLKHLQLTPMEIEVANHIKHGKSSKQIAAILDVNRKTVEFHRDNIRRKADIKNKKINLRTYILSLQ